MAPKAHRSASNGRLGARANSATKITITTNLQFTQKDGPASKHSDKQKKAGYGNEKAPLGRVNSSHRIQSRDQLHPLKRGHSSQRAPAGRARAGFTIASPNDEDGEDDDWVSSESGVATPNNEGSGSETASEAERPHNALYPEHHDAGRMSPPLQRVETARQADFSPSTTREDVEPPSATTPTLSHSPHIPVADLQSQLRRVELDTTKETRTDPPTPAQPSPRPSSHQGKRSSRPASTYSQSVQSESRPHPLIRGLSTATVHMGKPSAVVPLTVVTGGAAPPQLSTSPASSVHEDNRNYPATSPASTPAGSFTDDPAKFLQARRASISSARSIATQSVFRPDSRLERSRTLSTTSALPSSAALSALAHLPAITRPPSPQSVIFFPPVNPHANIDAIHPLLPGPYLCNHLTVLARRNPLRDSYDRVIRAKSEAARHGH